ncbi:MAG: exodeoxyribonuclease V subunit gamma [Deltaproteobacteria bacterium]|nr:exodeoxyribonuclease V subunit gamma [Deltaproteobacteria bacterium]
MAGLTLHTSNRLEVLARRLADTLAAPLGSPLEPEIIIVQSKGMERWLSMQLARRHAICANYGFPFPNAFIQELFTRLDPDLPERSPFAPDVMAWKFMELVPACLDRPGFDVLRAYLGDAPEGLKQYQLCRRIADTFDQYLLFRPSMIFGWESGKDDHWQAQLWRELVRSAGGRHRAAMGRRLFEALQKRTPFVAGLPERISVFGISALPRFHVELLAAVAECTRVDLFLMNPCERYWGDIVSEWEATRVEAREDAGENDLPDLYLEKGNSLLAAMGTLGRDFFDLLAEFPCREAPCFEEIEQEGMLALIQSDILHLRDAGESESKKTLIRQQDASIQIHACHSPMREMEVLHDRLLEMFENDPGLMPGDVLVMAPDIEAYSPYIQAVFDRPADDPKRIPFSIADRSARRESDLIDTFLAVLDLPGGRFTASQVMAVLDSPAVRRKFGFREADLEPIRNWVAETRIRWGFDAESRSRAGLVHTDRNTWRAGLDRLLLGYAMPGGGARLFGRILPYDHVEGDQALLAGRLARFIQTLFDITEELDRPRSLDEWAALLSELPGRMFDADKGLEKDMQVLRNVAADLETARHLTGYGEQVDLRLMKWHIRRSLEQKGFGFGFLTGGVTFCAMLPMRSIPFKVICLTGMNHDAYPRQARPVGFDLMAGHPMPGDRSRRNDDRYLFLEALLSARDFLHISYVGRSIRDNTPIPPSVLVSELIDYMGKGFQVQGTPILDHVLFDHRLQAFNPEYFDGSGRFFSYSRENRDTARARLGPRHDPAPFIAGGLSPPGDEWNALTLDDLCAFFGNPTRFLLTRRLEIRLERADTVLEDRELFDVKGLDRYRLENDILENKIRGLDPAGAYAVAQASGSLPYGTVGQCAYRGLSDDMEGFYDKLSPLLMRPQLDPLPIDLRLGETDLTGYLRGVYQDNRLQYRCGKLRPRDRLDTWIRHLALNCMSPDEYPRVTVLGGIDPEVKKARAWLSVEYGPVEECREILESLLDLYRRGLEKPLRFFPESSWQYIHRSHVKNALPDKALAEARKTWAGDDWHRGESEDPYYDLCFRTADHLDAEFQEIAEAVFGPMLEFQREIRGEE